MLQIGARKELVNLQLSLQFYWLIFSCRSLIKRNFEPQPKQSVVASCKTKHHFLTITTWRWSLTRTPFEALFTIASMICEGSTRICVNHEVDRLWTSYDASPLVETSRCNEREGRQGPVICLLSFIRSTLATASWAAEWSHDLMPCLSGHLVHRGPAWNWRPRFHTMLIATDPKLGRKEHLSSVMQCAAFLTPSASFERSVSRCKARSSQVRTLFLLPHTYMRDSYDE